MESEWQFAKTREDLIRMVENFKSRDKKILMPPAADIVDCILVEAWEYKDREAKQTKDYKTDALRKGIRENHARIERALAELERWVRLEHKLCYEMGRRQGQLEEVRR